MKLRHIEVFHAVYVTGSVSGGARALNVSQPSVSKVLKHAEDQLGFVLFDRISGRLVPSEKGIKLFAEIEPLYEQLNELDRFSANLKNTKAGHLRFAMTPAFGLEVGPVALGRFAKANRDTMIETETLHTNQVVNALLDRAIDIGLVFDAPNSPGTQALSIGKSGFVCVAPENLELPDAKVMKLERLRDLPLITLNQKSVLGKILGRRLEHALGIPAQGQIVVETYHLAKRLVKQNAGLAIIDAVTALSGDTRGLQIRKIDPAIEIRIDIVTRLNDPKSKLKSAFFKQLETAVTEFCSRDSYIHLVS